MTVKDRPEAFRADAKTGEGAAHSGKIDRSTFSRIISGSLGHQRDDVVVGPAHGLDSGIIDLGKGQVLTVTTDPLFVIPELGWDRAAWFAVHIVASDAATTALSLKYCTANLNLPLELSDRDLADLWTAIHGTCAKLGLAVVTGHTGRYEGCSFPTIGALSVMCTGSVDAYLSPSMARAGDALILTKGAAIETTALFGALYQCELESLIGASLAAEAAGMFYDMSVVSDAIAAAIIGVRAQGVHALHDAAEGGVLASVIDVATASQKGVIVDLAAISVSGATTAICDLVGIDPYTASSQGSLLIACDASRCDDALQALETRGIPARRIGEITPPDEEMRLVIDGREHSMDHAGTDGFWPALAGFGTRSRE